MPSAERLSLRVGRGSRTEAVWLERTGCGQGSTRNLMNGTRGSAGAREEETGKNLKPSY